MLHLATEPSDVIAVHTPTYPPFLSSVSGMGRRLLPIPMRYTESGWGFDIEHFAEQAESAGCRVLLLVNPHNPTGRVFTRAELVGLAEIAERSDLLVVADEIHADLAYAPHRHIPFASLGRSTASRTVTLSSATKAFNLAGVRCAVAHFGSDRLLAALDRQPPDLFGQVNVFGVAATLAAWSSADGWLQTVVRYLDGNRQLVSRILRDRLPTVRQHLPEAGYLSWLDCAALGLGPDPARTLLERGRIELSHGPEFGPGGEGCARLNFATSREVLDEILGRLISAATPARE